MNVGVLLLPCSHAVSQLMSGGGAFCEEHQKYFLKQAEALLTELQAAPITGDNLHSCLD